MTEGNWAKYDLIYKSIRGELQDDKQQELEAWLNEDEKNRRFFDEITDERNLIEGLKEFDQASEDAKIVAQRVLKAFE